MEISEVITDIYVSKKNNYMFFILDIGRWFISVLSIEEREWLRISVGSHKFSVIEEVF